MVKNKVRYPVILDYLSTEVDILLGVRNYKSKTRTVFTVTFTPDLAFMNFNNFFT